jgi:phosphoribosylaminoimidazolecarboxamide formyltransferase/IMP cyclohydrolase
LATKQALISVSDKSGILELASALTKAGWAILSSGGTAKTLKDAGLQVSEVSEYTGFPEIMDGRVKTLQPKIHGGILAKRNNESHVAEMEKHSIPPIDMVVVNLYPFRETVASGADFKTCVENIDIGGPAMLRAAAKNHDFVTVIVDPADYPLIINELSCGGVKLETRMQLAQKAFAHTAAYDGAIAGWLGSDQFPAASGQNEGALVTGNWSLETKLRYGENPHQSAYFQPDSPPYGIGAARQLHGKELSYNNIMDADAAWKLVSDFTEPACAIIKHTNPCGFAVGDNIHSAYKAAFECDTISAFGGIVALNRPVDTETAELIKDIFYEIIIAPQFSDEAQQILQAKKNLRLLECELLKSGRKIKEVRQVEGGLLVQDGDTVEISKSSFKTVTEKAPSPTELTQLEVALKVVRHVKSNAIVVVKNGAMIGIGAGQMSRVKSVELACEKAAANSLGVKGAVLASDAFFPFPDNIEIAAKYGISAIVQPGGSVKDSEVIAACNANGIAMVFSGNRHFRH